MPIAPSQVSSIEFTQLFLSELARLHSELFQSTAIVGAFAVLLILRGNKISLEHQSRPHYSLGYIMGGACFFLSFLLATHMQEQVKPSLILVDFLFLAGLVGGGRNAFITLGFVAVARYLFGGVENFGPALLDYLFHAVGGTLAREFILRKDLVHFPVMRIALVIIWHFICGQMALFIFWAADTFPTPLLTTLFARRAATGFTVSVFVITAVLLMVRQAVAREKQTYIFPSTGFLNRWALQRHIDTLHPLAHKGKTRPKTVLLINIDNFQQLLQSCGHDWVDSFMPQLSKTLQELCATPDIAQFRPMLFSFSEPTIIVILYNVTKEQVQEKGLAQSLYNGLTLFAPEASVNLYPSFTINVVDLLLRESATTPQVLRGFAMLEKQQTGRVQYFEPTLTRQLQLEEYIRASVTQWIAAGKAPVCLQPKMSLQDRACRGAEILLRLQDGESPESYVDPNDLLMIAEKHHMLDDLEWTVLKTAVAYLKQLPPQLAHIKVAVNITPDALAAAEFAQNTLTLLRTNNVSPRRLILEIIETHKFVPSYTMQENIMHFHAKGVWLSLDDFGTGYSAISLLSQHHFKELKLSQAMIAGSANPRVLDAIQLSLDSAAKYQACVVAEGIETEEQFERLVAMNVPFGQGYLFSKAITPEAFIRFALNHLPILEDPTQFCASTSVAQVFESPSQ